jgi:hypothetical protein
MGAWKAVFFLCVMAASSVAHAQGIANSFNELRLLVRTGDSLSVTSNDGREVNGKLMDLSSQSLTIRVGDSRREWQEADVAVIRQRRHDSLANGALWGFVGGVSFGGVAGAIYAAAEGGSAAGVAIDAGVFGAIGAGIGVGVDALIAKRVPIFERRSAGASVGVTPNLNTSRRGARVSIRF